MDRKTIFISVIGISLLIGIIRAAAKSWKMTEKEWKRRIATGNIGVPMKGKLAISSPFGNRTHPVTGQVQFHNGVDLISVPSTATLGANLFASAPGKVISNYYNDLGGFQLIIDSGYAVFGYAHLQVKSPLAVGTIVRKGQIIGKVGNTGRSTGPHLHFTLRLDGQLVNPAVAMPMIVNATK
jgi:murein DD-endopeptidase MepM/ murein hydrolase activator NlpD